MTFDPNKHRNHIEAYMSKSLGARVAFVQATQLVKSTREAPWKLTVESNGHLRSFVLQLDPHRMAYEYQALKAMESIPIPTPAAYGLDVSGEAIGVPCYFSEFIDGESLLAPVLAGHVWAEALYIDAVSALQAVTKDALGDFAEIVKCETAEAVLASAYADLKAAEAHGLVDVAYHALKTTMPDLPDVRFSNGDLWLENFIVKDRKLAGVIDFANATLSDPIFEFLLSFFVLPDLQGRGIEAEYCRNLGCDPSILHWYHGLEYFDTWRWVLKTGAGFAHHTAESLVADMQRWLGNG